MKKDMDEIKRLMKETTLLEYLTALVFFIVLGISIITLILICG